MTVKFGRRKYGILHNTIITVILIFTLFASLVFFFHNDAEEKVYDELNAEATYIKNDLTLRVNADRKNLMNLANYAKVLYEDGKPYDELIQSYRSIGLVSSIGILTPDNTFITKTGKYDFSDKISFLAESLKGAYISGRTKDLATGTKDIIICTAPVVSKHEVVGILYGAISVEAISEKYEEYVDGIGAQLYVYDKNTGKFVVDTVNDEAGELSNLVDREYNDNDAFEDFINNSDGFLSYKSESRNESTYVYYTTIGGDVNWGVILGRYESDLFKDMRMMTRAMILSLILMLVIIVLYFGAFLLREKGKSRVVNMASDVKKLLLEINQKPQNITQALKIISEASEARSTVYIDERGDSYDHIESDSVTDEYKNYFREEFFRYAIDSGAKDSENMWILSLDTDEKLFEKDKVLFDLFAENNIENVVFSVVNYNGNNGILCIVNSKNNLAAKYLINEISTCFSIAIYNKKYLNRTKLEATTDALTGILNRSAYEADLCELNEQKLSDVSCIYIDVNELHIRNNTYGHEAGDKMLIYIADSLKKTFVGDNLYRLGGDEFLVISLNTSQSASKSRLGAFLAKLEKTDYHVAIGISYRSKNANLNKMIKEAESRMYDSKANYYQNKMQTSVYSDNDIGYLQGDIDNVESKILLSAMKEHFSAILRVSLKNDTSSIIMAKAYSDRYTDEGEFSKRFAKYIDEAVNPDYHRDVSAFLNFDVLSRYLVDGHVMNLSYKKLNGGAINLSVYKCGDGKDVDETLWFFAKE